VDLTPRDEATAAAGQKNRKNRRWKPVLLLVVVLGAGGVIVTQFLTSAIDYYCNVDEVGVRSGCEGDRRLRVQGAVDEGSLKQAAGVTTFSLSFNDKTLDVRYDGDPGGVFQECIPVVAHGRLVNGLLLSDRIEVKHSNTYVAENEARIDDAEAAACSEDVSSAG
jgi:cytochrome c-type biogenesis protein CcmE